MAAKKHSFAKQASKRLKKLKRRAKLFQLKVFLLFILPVLAIYLAYETGRQYLKIKIAERYSRLSM